MDVRAQTRITRDDGRPGTPPTLPSGTSLRHSVDASKNSRLGSLCPCTYQFSTISAHIASTIYRLFFNSHLADQQVASVGIRQQVPQLRHGLCLDLAGALARQLHLLADLFQCPGLTAVEAET